MRHLRSTASLVLAAAGVAFIANGARVDMQRAGDHRSLGTDRTGAAVQEAWSATAKIAPAGASGIGGNVRVTPDHADPTRRTRVELLLDNPHPELARLHSDVRRASCARVQWGRDGRVEYELEPIDDGVTSSTTLDATVSTITGGGLAVVVLATDDLSVLGCADIAPDDPVLAASAGQAGAFERSCSAYLEGLTDANLAELDPDDLPQGSCRDEARDLVAGDERIVLVVTEYAPGRAERALRDRRACLDVAGLDVPPVEVSADGVAQLLLGLAKRDPKWSTTAPRCERAHPLPPPLARLG